VQQHHPRFLQACQGVEALEDQVRAATLQTAAHTAGRGTAKLQAAATGRMGRGSTGFGPDT
jgi:hypothetical protein